MFKFIFLLYERNCEIISIYFFNWVSLNIAVEQPKTQDKKAFTSQLYDLSSNFSVFKIKDIYITTQENILVFLAWL